MFKSDPWLNIMENDRKPVYEPAATQASSKVYFANPLKRSVIATNGLISAAAKNKDANALNPESTPE